MLVVIAGLIGAGKSSIAREASKRLNIPLYSIDDDKKRIRDPFLEKAKRIFGGVILTLVTVNDKLVKTRLEKREKKEDHMVGYGMYLSFKRHWEPFEKVDYHFVNEGDFERNTRRYVAFLKTKL